MYHKVNIKALKKLQASADSAASSPSSSQQSKLPDSVVEYLMWYHLGRVDSSALDSVSLSSIYRHHFSRETAARNLLPLLQSFSHRTDLGLAREINAQNGKPLFGSTRSLRTPGTGLYTALIST